MKTNDMQQEPSGVLIIDKPAGMTSHDVVGKIRRLYGTRRVGHTGTLDPMATGVLVILIGRTAKACEYLAADAKRYEATLRLGLTTDTEDVTGTLLARSEKLPTQQEFFAVLPQFRGKIQQIPPMYSALKVNGQKLVDLARQGVTVERKPREIEIFELDAQPTEAASDYLLSVKCSGGTYIRTLCADIGAALGCGAVMATLRRTQTSCFSIENAHTLAEIEEMTAEERLSLLYSTETLFVGLDAVRLPEFYERLCRSGCEIYLKKLGNPKLSVGQRLRLWDHDGNFFALGEVREYENGLAIKAIKTFALD